MRLSVSDSLWSVRLSLGWKLSTAPRGLEHFRCVTVYAAFSFCICFLICSAFLYLQRFRFASVFLYAARFCICSMFLFMQRVSVFAAFSFCICFLICSACLYMQRVCTCRPPYLRVPGSFLCFLKVVV